MVKINKIGFPDGREVVKLVVEDSEHEDDRPSHDTRAYDFGGNAATMAGNDVTITGGL